jgi:hypothetical protein
LQHYDKVVDFVILGNFIGGVNRSDSRIIWEGFSPLGCSLRFLHQSAWDCCQEVLHYHQGMCISIQSMTRAAANGSRNWKGGYNHQQPRYFDINAPHFHIQ